MPELPKIVISKLTLSQLTDRAPAGTAHPDPDLLTAFVERTAPDRERTAVLTHLAACALCREIVALAQPPATTMISVYTPKPTRPLFFLRWGALTACAVLVVSVALLHKPKTGEAPLLAKNQITVPVQEQSSAPSTATGSGSGNSKASKSEADKPTLEGDIARSPAEIATRFRADKIAPASARAQHLTQDNKSLFGSDAVVGSNVANTNSDLPLQGRNFSELAQLKPGVTAGAATAGPEPSPNAAPGAKSDGPADALKKSIASSNTSPSSETRAEAGSQTISSVGANPMLSANSRADEIRDQVRDQVRGQIGGQVRGQIRGKITDPSGAAVPDAKVTLTNTVTGAILAAATNDAGIYDVSSLPAGHYTIAISKPGFQSLVRPEVKVEPSLLAWNATLQIGTASEAVEVTSQATTAETATTPYAPTNKDDFRASSAPIANLDLATARQAATWQISPGGQLQRSQDGGKSWNSVPLDSKAHLRVVTATGFDIWAAGNNATLLHSHDSGNHFTTIKVHQKHQSLKGDIVTLTFPDAQTGRLETADHQVWTTTDAGKTWQPTALAK